LNDNNEETTRSMDLTELDINILLRLVINLLSAKAWQYIGLRIKPGTDKIEQNFEKAKLSIDCIVFLIEKLEGQISDDEKGKLRSIITDLQINFVNQFKS